MYEGIVSIFRKIEDPRKGNAIDYDLAEVLIISVLSILCGAQYFTQMEAFGHDNIEWLKTFLVLKNGIAKGFGTGSGPYLDVAKLVAAYREAVNPRVNVFCVQTAGYTNVCLPEYGYRTNILYGWTGKELLFADTMIRFWDEQDAKRKAR